MNPVNPLRESRESSVVTGMIRSVTIRRRITCLRCSISGDARSVFDDSREVRIVRRRSDRRRYFDRVSNSFNILSYLYTVPSVPRNSSVFWEV